MQIFKQIDKQGKMTVTVKPESLIDRCIKYGLMDKYTNKHIARDVD